MQKNIQFSNDRSPQHESENYTQEVINSLVDGIVILDSRGVVLQVNTVFSCFDGMGCSIRQRERF